MLAKTILPSLLAFAATATAAVVPRDEPQFPNRFMLQIRAHFTKWDDAYLVPSLVDPNTPTLAVGQIGDHSADYYHIDSHGRLTVTMWKFGGKFGPSKDFLYAAMNQDRKQGDYTQPVVFVPESADSSKWEVKGGFGEVKGGFLDRPGGMFLTVDGRDEFYVCEGVNVKGAGEKVYNSVSFAVGNSGRAGDGCTKVKLLVFHT